jgi:phage terminase large subunit
MIATTTDIRRSLRLFHPRDYQIPILKALDSGYKRVLAILPRRAGKDITALNYVVREMQKNPGVYYYIFPTYSQGRKIIWDSMTIEGIRMLDFFPEPWVKSKNAQEMKVVYHNGSVFQIVGSDNFDRLVGTNPRGVVFSEYALQDPRAYQYIRPILTANGGWALFISTPRGKNHLWDLYQLAKNSKAWFQMKLSVEDTAHIPMEEIEKEREEGIMSEDLIQQEYYTSFDLGVEGSYYSKYLDRARIEGRIGKVPWENGFQVHTAWDIGMRDSTSIIFFQIIGQTVRIIDCYENSTKGLEHYAEIIKSKPYLYGKHIAPHDIQVKEWGSGITRLDKARELGINFTLSGNVPVFDGIEACRTLFSKLYIDEKSCSSLLNALENYRREYDAKKKVYKNNPLHDWSSHFADAFRYLAVSLPKTSDGLSAEQREKDYYEAMYGQRSILPPVFQDHYYEPSPVSFPRI